MKKIISVITALAAVLSLSITAQARLVGDVNSDNEVNSVDALEILMYSVGKSNSIDLQKADINKDGMANSADALNVLLIAVGSYDGELEVEDETLSTSYKKDTVDPILESGEFTIKTAIVQDGKTIPSTIMIKGDDMSTDIVAEGIKCRMLILDRHCYMIFPTMRVYAEMSGVTVPITFAGDGTDKYVNSEYITLNGKTYVCETYKSSDGSVRKYYFLDGKWKAMETTVDGTTTTYRIDGLEKGVTEANFSLNGYFLVSDLSNYVK